MEIIKIKGDVKMNENIKMLIEEFVADNFCADGCAECHEIGHSIVPDDHKGSYDKAIEELLKEIRRLENAI